MRCSVANCFFWNEGNLCGADAIMVEIDKNAQQTFDEEIGGEMINTSRAYPNGASRSEDTCCHTFRPRPKA
ncbi:DUF1540 domain-containing protein [Numidum massiliense]|uniref:DUF1540 domain-containing protein n=1 Tax=Numidum massiliense TaxID=1522315 RepID=UPI0028FCD9EB|nr:DUF1540 domain-containing protein [Numidum massiliense]